MERLIPVFLESSAWERPSLFRPERTASAKSCLDSFFIRLLLDVANYNKNDDENSKLRASYHSNFSMSTK